MYSSIKARHRKRWKVVSRAKKRLRMKQEYRKIVTFNDHVSIIYVPSIKDYDVSIINELWWSPYELEYLYYNELC